MQRPGSPKKELKALVFRYAVVLGLLFLLVIGFLSWALRRAMAKPLVDFAINSMQQAGKKASNQPRVLVLNDGTRIECMKVNEGGMGYCAFIRKDGAASSVKKSDVNQIIELPPYTDAELKQIDDLRHSPRVFVLKTGERIECQEAYEQSAQYWAYTTKDGSARRVLKSSDVERIEFPDGRPFPKLY
jgi:hypothetical protein